MFRCTSRCCVLIVLATLMASCGPTVPNIRVWRPWLRSLQADEVKPRATLITIVDGTAEPLLGNEELTRLALKENLDRLLERRGFRITDSTPDYNVKLTYRVTRHDRLVSENRTFSYGAQSMSFYSGAGSKATSALGVAIARAVGSSALKMATATSQTTTEQASYVHALSVEFFGPTNSLVWKGESTWDSQRLDAIGSLAAPLQLVLSDLPSDPAHIPWVAAVKSTHALNYFTTKCFDEWFSCPALPYLIGFPGTESEYSTATKEEVRVPKEVSDIEALEAFVDLISTAEYALPAGSDKWDDPTDRNLWKKAWLGGTYSLGPASRQINILIKLSGTSEGYLVDEARVVSNEEYKRFEAKFAEWKQALRDYYDFYEK